MAPLAIGEGIGEGSYMNVVRCSSFSNESITTPPGRHFPTSVYKKSTRPFLPVGQFHPKSLNDKTHAFATGYGPSA